MRARPLLCHCVCVPHCRVSYQAQQVRRPQLGDEPLDEGKVAVPLRSRIGLRHHGGSEWGTRPSWG